jgi:hypothetical protein
MAKRPVFVPHMTGSSYVIDISVEFKWYPGFSLHQKQKTILALHAAAQSQYELALLLEISSRSPLPIGVKLSAFNLMFTDSAIGSMTVEVAFQGSKVFEGGGPFIDLYERSSREAKRDGRLRESGELVRFQLGEERWPLEPKTAFYDWLYLQALRQQPDLASQLLRFAGFSDIEFNPKRSINCQARSAALYVALKKRGLLDEALSSKAAFLRLVSGSDREMVQTQFSFRSDRK